MLSFFELSFYFAYFFLAGSSALTAFEVFNYFPPAHQPLKYILAIETAVNIIASFAYNKLLTFIKPPNYNSLTQFRYLDWFATTPLLLISFTLYLQYLKSKHLSKQVNSNQSSNTSQQTQQLQLPQQQPPPVAIEYDKLGIIILLNFIMLIFGFLGETGRINHTLGCIIGFIPFIALFWYIWSWYGDYIANGSIFNVFIIVWSLYGVVYFLPNTIKNISYNILDIIAKVGFGLLIWSEVVKMRLDGEIPSNANLIEK
jgi:bacteriorhodopsin